MSKFTNNIKKYVTIGFAGSQGRIGTTTQALQILQYLQLMGKKVCYIEMNDSMYIEKMKRIYNIVKYDKTKESYTIGDIEMYKSDSLLQISRADYDYIIKDYGNVRENFNKLSFLESDIRIIVAGAKPNEMFETTDCIREKSFFDVKYIFSFIPKEDRESIKEMMEDKRENTFFASLNVVEPFVYNSSANNTFKEIVDL